MSLCMASVGMIWMLAVAGWLIPPWTTAETTGTSWPSKNSLKWSFLARKLMLYRTLPTAPTAAFTALVTFFSATSSFANAKMLL